MGHKSDYMDTIGRYQMGEYQTFDCPFCEEHGRTADTGKHFYYYGPARGYHCFRCGAHQNWGHLPPSLQGADDHWGGELPDKVMRKYSQEPEYELRVARPVERFPEVLAYLKERGIESGTAARYEILYVPANLDHRLRGRIVFPVRDTGGKVIFYTARAFDLAASGDRKYLTPSTPKGGKLYFVGNLREPTICVVEGVFDAFACREAGYPAVALFGKEVNAQAARAIASVTTEAVVLLDPDAYDKAIQAQAKLSYYIPTRVRELPSDPSDVLRDSGPSVLRWYIEGEQGGIKEQITGKADEAADRTLKVVPRTGKRPERRTGKRRAPKLR